MGVEPKIGGKKPKMDGENNGKPYSIKMDDLGGTPIFGNTHVPEDSCVLFIVVYNFFRFFDCCQFNNFPLIRLNNTACSE